MNLKEFFEASKDNNNNNKKEILEYINQFKNKESENNFKIKKSNVRAFLTLLDDCIQNNKKLLIYGDYDVDGMFSTALLIESIKNISYAMLKNNEYDVSKIKNFLSKLSFKIPKRLDGYGLNIDKYEEVSKFADCLIVLDSGTNTEFCDIAKKNNTIFVFDHHYTKQDIEKNDNIINPNINGDLKISTGVLLYRFLEKLQKTTGYDFNIPADLACFTHISDVSSLNSHRDIIFDGLNAINNSNINSLKLKETIEKKVDDINNNIGKEDKEELLNKIQKLKKKENELNKLNSLNNNQRLLFKYIFDNSKKITTTDLSFRAIPLFNSIPRMQCDANIIIKSLLITQDNDVNNKKIQELVNFLYSNNDNRKKIVSELFFQIDSELQKSNLTNNKLIYYKTNITNSGFCGLIASQVAEKYNTNCIISAIDENKKNVFSGRGKEIHNILTELSKTDTMSFSFGGHKQALGGSIYNEENFINIVNLYNKNNIAQKQKNNINLDTQIMLSKKINIFDYIELCEFYSKKTKGVPFEKNIIVPTIISKDMILNLDECLSKKNQQFIALKIAFENPINNKEIELTYITKHHNCTKINHFFENNEVINCALNLQHNYNNEQKRVFFGDIIVIDSFNSAEEIKNSCKVDFKDDTHFKTKL